ncbi:hypothetical protein ACR03S_00435 [Limimaricola variabilis]
MIASDNEAASYYREIIEDYADEVLFEHAVRILRSFREKPFLDITDDHFNWPYASSKSQHSFADELFWVMKHQHVPELAVWGYESEIASVARRYVKSLSEAAFEFLGAACWPEGEEEQTYFQILETIAAALQRKVMGVVKEYDSEILEIQ